MDKNCIYPGCEFKTHRVENQYCSKHYWRFKKYGTADLPERMNRTDHPLYHLWWDRKVNAALVPEWLDFWKFVEDVSPKPEGYYFLVRTNSDPYGPTNFKWQEHLKRREGEPKKEWWARKWAARQLANPGMERNRELRRKFGLTIEEHEALIKKHKNKCAICGKPETAVDPKTGAVKRLAIDHCHKTGKIRGLLCWHCNSVLGKVEDSIPRLKKMILYLRRHR